MTCTRRLILAALAFAAGSRAPWASAANADDELRALAVELSAVDEASIPSEAGPDDWPIFAGLLASDQRLLALAGAQGLERLGPAASGAVPSLVAALDHADAGVRAAAADALASIGAAPARDALARLADADPDWRVRDAARGALLTLRTGTSLEDALIQLNDPFLSRDRAQAVLAATSSVPGILEWARADGTGAVARARVGRLLQGVKPTSASAEEWARALEHRATRGAAALALARSGEQGRRILVERLVTSDDDDGAWALAAALGSTEDGLAALPGVFARGSEAAARAVLIELLDDRDALLAPQAARILGMVEPPVDAEDVLRWSASDFYPEVATIGELAEAALETTGSAGELALREALSSGDPIARRRAAWAIVMGQWLSVEGSLLSDVLAQTFASDDDPLVRALCLRGLMLDRLPEAPPPLDLAREALFDRSLIVRDVAAQLLGWLEPEIRDAPTQSPSELAHLVATVSGSTTEADGDEYCDTLRSHAAHELVFAMPSTDEAFAMIVHAAVDVDWHEGWSAERFPHAGSVLGRAARSGDPLTRLAALRVLRGMRPRPAEAGRIARGCLRDRVPVVRAAAVRLVAACAMPDHLERDVRPFLKQPWLVVRVAAIEGLHATDLATTRSLLADPSPQIRAAALRAADWDHPLPQADILKALADAEPSVRAAAEGAAFSRCGLVVPFMMRHALIEGVTPRLPSDSMALSSLAIPDALLLARGERPESARWALQFLGQFACSSRSARRAVDAAADAAERGPHLSGFMFPATSSCGEGVSWGVPLGGEFRTW